MKCQSYKAARTTRRVLLQVLLPGFGFLGKLYRLLLLCSERRQASKHILEMPQRCTFVWPISSAAQQQALSHARHLQR